MRLSIVSIVLGVLLMPACFSATKWNADQAAALRKRAAFDLSCPPEDLEILAAERDAHGLAQKMVAVGCEKKVTFINAKGGFATAQWTLGPNRDHRSKTHASASERQTH